MPTESKSSQPNTINMSLQMDNGVIARSNEIAPHQLILTGYPGSGKSHIIRMTVEDVDNKIPKKNVWRTAFHHESTFGDLVGSYKPEPWYIASNGGDDPAVLYDTTFAPMPIPQEVLKKFTHKSGGELKSSTQLVPTTLYTYRPGPIILAYVSALLKPNETHVLIIEEINRANPSHVFGDLIQLLDRREDGSSEYGVSPSPDLDRYLTRQLGNIYNGQMILPPNLFIWATMNRADETVSHMDTAFLRRWTIKYLRSDGRSVNDKQTVAGADLPWGEFRDRINTILTSYTYIEADKYIGPYFLSKQEIGDLDKVFSKLIMYLWHDVLTMDRERVFVSPTIDRLNTGWIKGDEIFINFTQN